MAGLWDSLIDFSGGGMGAGMLGLAGISDIMGAYSRAEQEKRQRDIYNKLRDPNALMSLYQPMSAAGTTAVNRDINTNLASRGIQDGGAGTQFAADAWAKLEQQRLSDAVNQYIRALTGAGGNTGAAAGGSGATMDMMKQIMLYRMLGQKQPGAEAPNPYGSPTGMDTGAGGITSNPSYMGGVNPYGNPLGGWAQPPADASLNYFGGGSSELRM